MPPKSRLYFAAFAPLFAGLFPPLALPANAATVTWVTDNSGLWNVPSNWSSNPSLPGPNDDVVIDRGAANPTITLGSSATVTIKSLTTNEKFDLAGTLNVGSVLISNTFRVVSGVLHNANITATAGGSVVVGGSTNFSTLDGVIFNSDVAFGSSETTVFNNLVFNGNTTISNSTRIEIPGTQTITGTGNIFFSNQASNSLWVGSGMIQTPSALLTIGPGITIHGGGSGTASAQILAGVQIATLVNQGTINADVTGTHIFIFPNGTAATFINSGSLLATNGGQLNVNELQSNSGLIAANNGVANLSGTWTNSGTLSASSATLTLAGSLNNTMLITADSAAVTISAALTNSGTLSLSNGGQLIVSNLQSNSGLISAKIAGANVSGTWTNSGTLSFSGGSLGLGGTWSNSAHISSTADLITLSGTWTNSGTLALSSGTLNLGGNFTTADLNIPTFSNISGLITISGALNNSNSILPLSSQTGNITLSGTIHGGTLTTADNTALIAQGGSLDNLTLSGQISLSGSSIAITNNLTLANGLLAFNSSSNASTLSIAGAQSITGTGSLALTSAGILSGPGSLSLGPSVSLSTSAPTTIALSLTTAGAIAATAAPITFAGPSFSASGSISASNSAALNFSSGTVLITSPISLSNSTITFSAPSQSISSITGTGTVTLSANHALTSDGIATTNLILGDSSTLTLRNSTLGTSKISQLTFNAATSTLNINQNKFIIQANAINKPGLIAALNNDILLGLSTNWNGPGLISSAAANDPTHYEVQLFDNAVLGLADLNGQSLDQNSLIVSLNHIGDANLSGIVDIQDLSLITNHWQLPASTPTKGDLNHDGFTDLQDLTIVTNNWQQSSTFPQLPITSDQLPPTPAPEPASLLLLAFPALLVIRRKTPEQIM